MQTKFPKVHSGVLYSRASTDATITRNIQELSNNVGRNLGKNQNSKGTDNSARKLFKKKSTKRDKFENSGYHRRD